MLLRDELSLAVVTNDIFTTEDAEALRRADVLPTERIVAVETGCCPHTAIRDDIAANLDAAEALEAAIGDVDLTLIESGGDNLTAIFSRGLVDAQVFVLDTAGGDDVPRKGGPGVATADLLVINKVDLAPHVGADVDRMLADATARRTGPVLPTSLRAPDGAAAVADWVRSRGRGVEGAGADVRAAARIEVARRDGRDVLVDVRSEPPLAVRAAGRSRPARRQRRRARRRRRAGPRRRRRRRRPAVARHGRGNDGVARPDGSPSTQTVARRRSATGGHLRWVPEPLVAVAGCRHHSDDDRRRSPPTPPRGSSTRSSLGRTGEPSGDVDDDVARRARRAAAAPPRRAARARRAGVGSAVTAGRHRHLLAAIAVGRPAPDAAPVVTPDVAAAVLAVAAGRLGRAGRRVVAPRARGRCRRPCRLIRPGSVTSTRRGWPTRR